MSFLASCIFLFAFMHSFKVFCFLMGLTLFPILKRVESGVFIIYASSTLTEIVLDAA